MKLEAQGLTKNYAEKIVVDNLNIIVKPGEIVGLLGPNGAGKTTFFYMIAGLIKSDSGAILINGQDITIESVSERANKGLAYLPQEPSIFTRLTVEENLLAALEQRKDINEEEFKKLIKYIKIQKKALEKHQKSGNYDSSKIVGSSILLMEEFKSIFENWFKDKKL